MSLFAARGRGRHYTRRKALVEHFLRTVYVADWPARLWGMTPSGRKVELVRHELALLPQGSPDLRLVFASDLHLGPTTANRMLERAFELVAAERPDVLVLGGDYVYLDATPERADRLRKLVASVPARCKLAVLGNHDLWADHRLVEVALAEAGARVLVNESIRLPAPHHEIHVVGLDEPWTGNADTEAALRGCPIEALKILVCHSPDGFSLLPSGIALYLAGHTHGGHIALPGGVPVVLPPGPGSRRWSRGFYDVGEGIAFVSKGLGGAEVPIRAFAEPEVVSFTLRAGG